MSNVGSSTILLSAQQLKCSKAGLQGMQVELEESSLRNVFTSRLEVQHGRHTEAHSSASICSMSYSGSSPSPITSDMGISSPDSRMHIAIFLGNLLALALGLGLGCAPVAGCVGVVDVPLLVVGATPSCL